MSLLADDVHPAEAEDVAVSSEAVLERCMSTKRFTAFTINCMIVTSVMSGVFAGILTSFASAEAESESSSRDVREIIEDPDAMFSAFGFVAAPLAFISLKGLFNFSAQQAIYLGKALLRGREAVRDKLDAPVRLSKSSIAFQALGLASSSFAYTKLVFVTTPWKGWPEWEVFSYLTSQHTATVTVLVSLATNSVIWSLVEEDEESSASYHEASVAQMLVVFGLIVGGPLWLSLVWPLLVYALPLMASTAISLKLFQKMNSDLTDSVMDVLKILVFNVDKYGDRQSTPDLLFMRTSVLGFLVTGLLMLWLALGINRADSWLFFGATVLEIILPLVGIMAVMGVVIETKQAPAQLLAFQSSMLLVYLVVSIVPAAIMMWQSEVGVVGSAPAAFMGKKIMPFIKYTFVYPAGAMSAAVSRVACSRTMLWVAQLLSFFT